VASQWLSSAALDYGIVGAPGVWLLDQANFRGPQVDGCIDRTRPAVVELSWVDPAGEGTVDHGSFYLLAAAELDTAFGAYNFDNVVGGNGCNAATIRPAPVPSPGLTRRIAACTGLPGVVTTYDWFDSNANDFNYFDVEVAVDPFPPEHRTAAVAGPLIAGYQVLYQEGGEPTSSGAGGWRPARDLTRPATDPAPMVPVGTVTARVALPKGVTWTTRYWVALRLVYRDARLNQGPGEPRLVSPVGGHCGPLEFGGVIDAVEFGAIDVRRTRQGVVIDWTTLAEDDTLGFRVHRAPRRDASEAQVVGGLVPAHGPFAPYTFTDLSAAGDTATLHYYLQEVTVSGGDGDRSPWLTVAADPGGRGRGRGRRPGTERGR
jgi:hypothetical protein